MPAIYCEYCEKLIDLDYDVEHFDENEKCLLEIDNEEDDEDFSGASHDNNGNEYPDTDR